MARHHLQVLVSNVTVNEAYARGMMGVDLPGLNVAREKYEGVRVVATDQRPELDAMLLVLEHPRYPETEDLAECPRVSLADLPDVVPPLPDNDSTAAPEEPVAEEPAPAAEEPTPTGSDTGGPAEEPVPTPPTPEPEPEPTPAPEPAPEPTPDEPVLEG